MDHPSGSVKWPYSSKPSLSEEECLKRKDHIKLYSMMVCTDPLPEGYTWYNEQIAGHNVSVRSGELCQIGIIQKSRRHILKLVMPFERGECEVWFYQCLQQQDSKVVTECANMLERAFFLLLPYTPKFCGIENIVISGIERKFLVLEDLLANFSQPCTIDIKMGRVSYDPFASDKKKEQELKKCPYQLDAGFRFLGFRKYVNNKLTTRDRIWGREIDDNNVFTKFSEFFEADPHRVMARIIHKKLNDLKKIFEHEKKLHFFASSILLIYEGDATKQPAADVKLIDFSHVFVADEVDMNYLPGLLKLISLTESLVNST